MAHQTPEAFSALEREYALAYQQLDPLERRVKSLTAEEYLIPSVRLATAFAEAGASVWMFRFDHVVDALAGPWAAHVTDLPFWWNNLSREAEQSSPDRLLAEAMHGALVQFVIGEAPSAPGLSWPTYDLTDRSVLVWSVSPELVSSPSESDLKVWRAVNVSSFDRQPRSSEPMCA